MFTVHVRMLIIQQLTICNFHFLLSIDKMKENNQYNKLLNEHKMLLNLYSTISLSNITNDFMVKLRSNINALKLSIAPAVPWSCRQCRAFDSMPKPVQ